MRTQELVIKVEKIGVQSILVIVGKVDNRDKQLIEVSVKDFSLID